MKLNIFLLVLLTYAQLFSQQFVLKGKVYDKNSLQQGLAYSNIRIAGTLSGTSATVEGFYELRLTKGNYQLIVSNIGYTTDTVSVKLNSNETVNIGLTHVPVNLPEVTVLPGENPALEIIRRVITSKNDRDEKINSYVFNAYTKGIVKTTKDFSASGTSVGVGIGGGKDTSKLKITGIIENESKGYFRKPNEYKDEIIARKQSANTPSAINIFTGGRLIQNFYRDDIRFFNRPLLSPIADDAIDYYDYFIEDTLALDKKSVFKIKFEPLRKIDPGFVGTIYIADKTYNLVKLEVGLNTPANPGKIFDKINILQQFTEFENNIVMPIDYRISVEGNPLGLVKFGFELNTIFYDYQINNPLGKDIFDMTILKVKSDADKKDSLYWKSTQTIPNTEEELEAYARIDSIESKPKKFWDRFSLFSPTINIEDNISITGPLSIYSFNRVEGHTLNFGINAIQQFNKRSSLRMDLSYGFDDQKFKGEFAGIYYLGEHRTSNLTLRAFNKLTDLFSEAMRYSKLTSSLVSLIGKYDFRDYYYTKGFNAGIWSQVFPVLSFGIGYQNRTDNSAYVNTDFSIINTDKIYNSVQQIYETRINAITTNFQLDFRKFIEDGYFKRKVNQGGANFTLGGYFTFSNSSFLKSSLDFQLYRITLNGYIPTFGAARTNFNLTGFFTNGRVPFQMMYALPGNISGASQSSSFRTLRTDEVFGDNAVVLSIDNDLGDEFFRLLRLDFLIDWQVNMSVFLNAAIVETKKESRSILPFINRYGIGRNPIEFTKPFAEAGFAIGQALFPFKLEFTWKLNYFGINNFVFGLNAPIL
ncbi:MAG: hypothetical protein FD143_2405 [Ignavibacteria bacterium]|nr:MAG: hypothetical protein FD143_2405 [Ignavibacteria bacterium]KAF0157170.1 MAG: hypothetical protein FD188_2811 [Ignavibacteria bacterium]